MQSYVAYMLVCNWVSNLRMLNLCLAIQVLAINRFNPLRKYWDPQLLFTGTSIMTINPKTGRAVASLQQVSCAFV